MITPLDRRVMSALKPDEVRLLMAEFERNDPRAFHDLPDQEPNTTNIGTYIDLRFCWADTLNSDAFGYLNLDYIEASIPEVELLIEEAG